MVRVSITWLMASWTIGVLSRVFPSALTFGVFPSAERVFGGVRSACAWPDLRPWPGQHWLSCDALERINLTGMELRMVAAYGKNGSHDHLCFEKELVSPGFSQIPHAFLSRLW